MFSAQSFTLTDRTGRILVLDTYPPSNNDLDGVLTDERMRVWASSGCSRATRSRSQVGDLMDERYERFVGDPVLLADAITPRRPCVGAAPSPGNACRQRWG